MSYPSNPEDTINYVIRLLDQYSIAYNNPINNIDYYGNSARRKNNFSGYLDGKRFRICLRTQFTGGGAWQKMIYTYEMLRTNSPEENVIFLYHGTDKRFLHHMHWIKNEYSKKDSRDSVKIMDLIEFTKYIRDTSL